MSAIATTEVDEGNFRITASFMQGFLRRQVRSVSLVLWGFQALGENNILNFGKPRKHSEDLEDWQCSPL
jgi:hypothetical protein